jgi:hypothetical protein
MRALFVAFALVLANSITSAAQQQSGQLSEPQEILDYFDGLRAFELGQPEIASGIWLQAADRGDLRAIRKIAQLYEKGEHLPQDDVLAFFWFAIAMKLGDQGAKEDATRVFQRIPSEALGSLERAVYEWKPKPVTLDQAQQQPSEPPHHPKSGTIDDLISALNERNLSAFKEALANGASPTATSHDGTPILFLAVAIGQVEFVRALFDVERGPKVDANVSLKKSGMTALHLAAGQGNQEIVSALLVAGANPILEDGNGVRPVELARMRSHSFVASILDSKASTYFVPLLKTLEKHGYISSGQLDDRAAQRLAVKMFQNGQTGLTASGRLDAATYGRIVNATAISYIYAFRYEKDGKFWISHAQHGTFSEALNARQEAIGRCERGGGKKCRFNFAPAGACIVTYRPPSGWFFVSGIHLTADEAAGDARAQCLKSHDSGCTEEARLCAPASTPGRG